MPPETNEPPASTSANGTLQDILEAEIQAAFPTIASLRVRRSRRHEGLYDVSARVPGDKEKAHQIKSELARDIIKLGRAHGVLLVPQLRLSHAGPSSATEPPPPTDPEAIVRSLTDILTSHRDDLKRQRKLVSKVLSSNVDQLESLRRSEHLPQHVVLHGINRVLEDTFTILFALESREFDLDPASLEVFKEQYCGQRDHGFEEGQFFHFLQSLGEEELQRERYFLGQERVLDFDIKTHVGRSTQLVNAALRYVDRTLVTERELRRRRRVSVLGAIAAALAGVSIIVAVVISKLPLSPIQDTDVITAPGGIVGVFYADKELTQELLLATTPQIRFKLTNAPFVPDAPSDRFAVRWEGFIRFAEAGKYQLCSSHDDGARVFLKDDLIIDDWHDGATRTKCEEVNVTGGWYPLTYEYYDAQHGAEAQLLRGKDEKKLKPVPAKDLCCKE